MGWVGEGAGHRKWGGMHPLSSSLQPLQGTWGLGFFFPSHTMIPEEEGKEKEAPCHVEAGGSLRGERQPAAGPARNPALLPAQRKAGLDSAKGTGLDRRWKTG